MATATAFRVLSVVAAHTWTLENKRAQRDAEPDECYVFGQVANPKRLIWPLKWCGPQSIRDYRAAIRG